MKKVSFTEMKHGTKEDYLLLDKHEKAFIKKTPDRILKYMSQLTSTLEGYQVSRLEHSLQSATRALQDKAEEEMIVAALLHDIGDELAFNNHSEIAAAILKPYVSEKTHWIVEKHGMFQLYYYAHHLGYNKNERDKYKNITPPKYLGAIDAIQSESMSLNSLEKIKIFKGVPASLGKSIGPAKIIKSFEDSAKLKEGDIMVCISTNPSWTPLFGIVSGIISETGGTLSHTAVVAREYNIPTILEVENSTELISDNDLIEVDADKGIITIIS